MNYYAGIPSGQRSGHIFFFFQISQMRETIDPNFDGYGRWCPPKAFGANAKVSEEHKMYYYNGRTIVHWALQPGTQHFKTFSVYYSDRQFHQINYDATLHQVGDGIDGVGQTTNIRSSNSNDHENTNWACWQPLTFEHDNEDYSSFVCFGGDQLALRTQRPNQTWTRRLLPSYYHAHSSDHTTHQNYGGMDGELPLILALLAFSVKRRNLDMYLTSCSIGGRFTMPDPSWEHGRTDRRGIVVTVWSWPPYCTADTLRQYESGVFGHLFP